MVGKETFILSRTGGNQIKDIKMLTFHYVLNILTTKKSDYVFYDGKPIDRRRHKYCLWRRWYKNGPIKCRCCSSKAIHIKLIKCEGPGSIHKESGETKYTFKLFDRSKTEITVDHWIPKSFLKKKRIKGGINNNLVPMCRKCNKLKAFMIPIHCQR